MWTAPFMQNVDYDPVRDFVPITLAVSSPTILVVHPSMPVKSVAQLVTLAKAKPGALNYASGTPGAATHLAAELFKSMAGVDIAHVPYKGGVPAVNALISGEVQLMFAFAGTAIPFIKSGRMRALAVTSAQPSPLAPGLVTIAASGLPGYEVVASMGMFAPVKTPETVITRLNQEMSAVLNRGDIKEKLFNGGMEVIAASPLEAATSIKSEMSRMGKVIRDAGIRTQ
jgi:tripartite-type tricarboxylate transporter receptor subunit TctC